MQIAIAIIAILVVGAIVGTAINFLSWFLGLPFALIFIGAVIGKETMDRQRRILQMKRFRREVRAPRVDFSDDDKHTLVG